ncbi:MAG: hypothetical protein MJZ47_04605 [Bacteroidales bacterium]|nr:hypothetical protein [Bacteroidales bacterium]
MIGTIIYIIGIILGVKAVLEIIKEPISTTGKLIAALVVLLLSWVGIAIYYIFMRGNLTKWFK